MDKAKVASELVGVAKLLAAERTRKRSAAREEFSVIVDLVTMNVVEQDYDRGEIGPRKERIFKRNYGSFKSVADVVKSVSAMTGVPERYFRIKGDGRISAFGNVDDHNRHVDNSARSTEEFQKGEFRIWSAYVDIWLLFAKTYTPEDREIAAVSSLRMN